MKTKGNKMKLFTAIFLATATMAQTAMPQSSCLPRMEMVKILGEKASLSLQSIAITDNENLMEVFVNDKDGSWAVVITHPEGYSCYAVSGKSFVDVPR